VRDRSVFEMVFLYCFFFFQAEDGIRDWSVTGVQTCALPISLPGRCVRRRRPGIVLTALPGEQPPDTELLRRHVNGDADAFGLLFTRHKDRLWAVAVRTLGDPEEAADALQDAMISAFRPRGGVP